MHSARGQMLFGVEGEDGTTERSQIQRAILMQQQSSAILTRQEQGRSDVRAQTRERKCL
jgi:hypothetical protein